MTAFQPLLIEDIGFQLSFTATLGLMLYGQPVNQRIHRRLKHRKVPKAIRTFIELLIITAAAQLATTPVILLHFARFARVALLVNGLVLWAQPIIMTVGGLATIGGLLWLPLGQTMAWGICYPLLLFTIQVVE